VDPVRIELKKEINSDKFRAAALHFQEHGYYVSVPQGTTEWRNYWIEEARRCLYGFTAEDGDYITGYFYFYLNYCPINRIIRYEAIDKKTGEKKMFSKKGNDFPQFYDYDRAYFDMLEKAKRVGRHLAVIKKRRAGYEQPVSEEIITPSGIKKLGDIEVGDIICNPAGHSTQVREIVPQGIKDVYELEFQDGRKVTCGEHHLWSLFDRRKNIRILETKDLFNFKLKQGGKGKETYTFHLPEINPVKFYHGPRSNVPIDPYVLGILIGDGHINGDQVKFSTDDYEIFQYIQYYLAEHYIVKETGTPYQYVIVSKQKGINKLNRELKDLNLKVKSYNKFIPDIYKFSSVEERFELVRGLLDSDGSINKRGSINFVSSSEKLVDDLSFVLRGLGIRNTKRKTKLGGRIVDFPNGKSSLVRDTWTLIITTEKEVFKLYRKRIKIRKDRKYNCARVALKSVRKLDYKEEQRCLVVDDPNSLYLTKDFIPTHNSFKNGSMLCRNFYLIPGSKSYAIASEAEFLLKDGMLTKAWDFMDFLDEHTAWGKKRQKVDTKMHKRASYIIDINGIKTEMGFKSEIIGVTLKNDVHKIRGKAGLLYMFEEGGQFPNLTEAWQITLPSVRQDDEVFGQMVVFGTGGSKQSNFEGLKNLFYEPDAYECLPIENIWDEGKEGTKCGFFVPEYLNMWGPMEDPFMYMDSDGNSNIKVALGRIEEERERVIQGASDKNAIDRYIAEHPITPEEACLIVSGNIFPKKELITHLATIRNSKTLKNFKQVGELIFDDKGNIRWELTSQKKDITDYRLSEGASREGAIVIWEHPIQDPPYGLYIGGCDPYDHDKSLTNSLGSCIIYKRFQDFESYYDLPVAEYTGRPDTAEEYYENVRKLLLYYKANLLYENEKKGLFTYFSHKHSEYLLADQPDIIKDIIKDSKVERGKGIHMNKAIKDWGEGLIKEWLSEEYVPGKKNLTKILSLPLLEELISYNDEGNFDRCIAEGTKISTKEGFKNIEDIREKDLVLTHNGNFRKVTKLDNHHTKRDILEFKIIGNYETLKVTDNHPIYSATTKGKKHNIRIRALDNINFVEAKELNNKYQFVLQPKRKLNKGLIWPTKYYFNDDLMYLLGWYVSDGYIKDNQISFCLQKDQMSMALKLKSILNRYGEQDGKFHNGRQYSFKGATILEKDNYIKIRKGSEVLARLLEENGGTSNNKQLSKEVYSQPNSLMLLVGYLEGDGHQKKNANYDGYKRETIEVSGVYETLVKQMRQIGIDNGIWSSIRCIPSKDIKHQTQYGLTISRKYINKIAQYSLKFNEVEPINIIEKNYQYETEDGFWTPIKLIDQIEGDEIVYNFEVEDDNSYIASNIAVHNCMAFMMVMIYREQLHHVHVKKRKDNDIKKILFPEGIFRNVIKYA